MSQEVMYSHFIHTVVICNEHSFLGFPIIGVELYLYIDLIDT